MYHDIAYSKSNNLNDRHIADKILEEKAWTRAKSKDAGLGERSMALLTTALMRGKRALGAGLKEKKKKRSTQYTNYPVNLEESEKTAIILASQNKRPVGINVNLFRTKDSIMNETSLPLTTYQVKKLKKAQKEGKNKIQLKLSAKQVQYYKQGGFLPALLAAAPAAAALGSIATNIYNSYQNKKANNRLIEEKIRHNKALEGSGLRTKKKKAKRVAAKGIYMNKRPRGEGVYLSRKKSVGNGLLEELLQKKKKTPLSNLDILSYAKKLHLTNFRGVFMCDKLPKSPPRRNECGIINLDTSKGLGTHWIAYRKVGPIVHYYDSFGVPPPCEVQRYFINSVILFNCEQEQKFDQVICGHLCLKFLVENNNKNETSLEKNTNRPRVT